VFDGITLHKDEAVFIDGMGGTEDDCFSEINRILAGQCDVVIAERGNHTVTAQCTADETFTVLLVKRKTALVVKCACSFFYSNSKKISRYLYICMVIWYNKEKRFDTESFVDERNITS
jgi:hypothetical protein